MDKDLYNLDKDLKEKMKELEEYAELEGSENGDYWNALCNFSQFTHDMDSNLKEEIINEVDRCLEFIENNYELTEREVIHTYKVKELEWKYE